MRRLPIFLLLIVLFSTVHAQSGWSAWLLTPDEGRMTWVNESGFVEDLILPLPPGFDAYDFESIYQMNVAPDGNLIAYVVINRQTIARTLLVYNHELRGVIATYDLTGIGADSSASPVFSEDSTQLAIGYSLSEGANSGWEIIIVDLATFSILTDLRDNNPQIVAPASDTEGFPSISWFSGDQLAFTLVADDVDETVSYLWNTLDGSLTAQEADTIYPPTGEIVTAAYDERLPARERFTEIPNVLRATDRNGRYLFYSDPDAWLFTPRFVGNGSHLAFLRLGENFSQWRIINRAGEVVQDFDDSVYEVEGTADGYLYLEKTDTLKLYQARLDSIGAVDGAISQAVLVYDSGTSLDSYIVWVGNPGGFPLFTAQTYPAWGEVIASAAPADRPEVVGASASPTPNDTTLRAGINAIVNTTSGDSLNLRTDAGTQYQIRKKLPRGTDVIVIEGPVEAEGFNWWRVREPGGVEGWVVDYASGVLTLVPRAVFGTETIDTEAAANPSMESLLQIGDTAVVTLSTRNDALRLRNGAGLNFRVITLLPPASRVTIVDGARMAENLTWWQIRTSEGNIGWAAEIIGSERALTRDDTAPRATADATPELTSPAGATATYAAPSDLIPPLLVSPLPDTVLTNNPRTVTLSWSPVPGAVRYTLEIEGCAGNLEACTPLQSFPDLTATTYNLTTPADGLYRWRVLAAEGSRGSESDWWSFSFDTP